MHEPAVGSHATGCATTHSLARAAGTLAVIALTPCSGAARPAAAQAGAGPAPGQGPGTSP